MKWTKAPEELKKTLDTLMASVEREKRIMFGYPAYFINRNMFSGLFQDKLFLRLPPEQAAALRKPFPALSNLEPMPGRPMKDYYVIPEKLYTDAARMGKVIEQAAAFCRNLPEKKTKPKKKI